VKNVTGSGGKWVDVSAERFPGWIASFAGRHEVIAAEDAAGRLAVSADGTTVTFTAPDGAVAQCHPPFAESLAPLADAVLAGPAPVNRAPAEIAETIAAHARTPRTVGVLLVRLGGYAAGVFAGYPPELVDAKAGARLVHGRSAAGGWSQQRFARRREKQASEALEAAASTAVSIFGRGPRLDALVLGGDKRAIAVLRADPRLARYLALATERFLTVPDPKRSVLLDTPRLFTAVRIRLPSPGGTTPRTPRGPAR
jgi:Actinobacteria/chloroflexi VLRF1 release factor